MKRKHYKPVKRKYSFTKCLIHICNLLPPDTSEIRSLISSIMSSVRFKADPDLDAGKIHR